MTLTEEEAKTKRCQESFPAADALSPHGHIEAVPLVQQSVTYPFGQMGGGYASVGTIYARHTAPTNCIGSACMAWRWVKIVGDDGYTPVDTDKGYCGKAGRS